MATDSTPAAQAAALYGQGFAERARRRAVALRAAARGEAYAIALDHEHLAQEVERPGESRGRAEGRAPPGAGGGAEPGAPA